MLDLNEAEVPRLPLGVSNGVHFITVPTTGISNQNYYTKWAHQQKRFALETPMTFASKLGRRGTKGTALGLQNWPGPPAAAQ